MVKAKAAQACRKYQITQATIIALDVRMNAPTVNRGIYTTCKILFITGNLAKVSERHIVWINHSRHIAHKRHNKHRNHKKHRAQNKHEITSSIFPVALLRCLAALAKPI